MTYNESITILHIKHGASKDEIKKAFVKLAHIHHPDKGGDAKKFIEVKSAYDFLMVNDPPAQSRGGSGFGYNDRWWNPVTGEWEDVPPTTARTTTRSKVDQAEYSWSANFQRKADLQQQILKKKVEINGLESQLNNLKFQLAMLEMQLRDF